MQGIELLVRFKYLLFFFLLNLCTFGQSHPNAEVDQYLKEGINELLNQNYSKAKQIFTDLRNKHPYLPFGDLYSATTEILKIADFSLKPDKSKILPSLNSGLEIAKSNYEMNENDPWNVYSLGLAHGFYAYYYLLNEDFVSAFMFGYKAISFLEECIAKDVNFYDSYIAIGTYKYWKSRKTEFLDGLPFIKDETKLGISFLKKAIQNNSYNNFLGINSLIWIYVDQKDYYSALKLSESVLNNYPDNRLFIEAQARCYEEIDKQKAIDIYLNLFYKYKSENSNHYNELILIHKIAKLNSALENVTESLKYCDLYLSYNIEDEYVKSRLIERTENVIQLRKELRTKSKNMQTIKNLK